VPQADIAYVRDLAMAFVPTSAYCTLKIKFEFAVNSIAYFARNCLRDTNKTLILAAFDGNN